MVSMQDAVAKAVVKVTADEHDARLSASFDQVNLERRQLGLAELGRCLDQEADGAPACDACGKEASGTMQCAQCQAVFYCSRECQRNAWKAGGHKQECDTMKEEVEAIGMKTVKRMNDTTLPTIIRVQGLKEIDGSGPYRFAVQVGLHKAIQGLFQNDLDGGMALYRQGSPDIVFATQFIMSGIFRGQRREGKGQWTGGNFRCIDGQRIKEYVESHPDAFDVWFNASLELYQVMLDGEVFRNRTCQQQARIAARDVWAAWVFVFVNKRATKKILMPAGSKDDIQVSVDRVKSIALRIKGILRDRWDTSSSDLKDTNGTLEGLMNQIVAQINYWCKAFEIPVDFESLLDFNEEHLQMYLQLGKPIGEGTIAKGFTLTMDETRAVMLAAAPAPKPRQRREGKGGGKKCKSRGRR
jgi:hypothetical protein